MNTAILTDRFPTLVALGCLVLFSTIGGCQYDAVTEGRGSRPEASRFIKVDLASNLHEPMELAVLPGGQLLFIERRGAMKQYDPDTGQVRTVATLEVFSEKENGLLGLALDPEYPRNGWIYLFYSPPDRSVQQVSRFNYDGTTLDLASESLVIEIPHQRVECCHSGGALEFGPGGNLFITVGDDTNPFASDGYGPMDERPGREPWDAQRTSANSNDLRGKILRIRPQPDGGYTIPEGNLFPPDTPGARPEIYVMGCRNPFRPSLDMRTGFLYWGDVGPDASEDHQSRGPKGHDEINQARQAGYFGWPLFVGDNKPYYDFDFETSVSSDEPFDSAAPVNRSPNNSGLEALPPAQPAFIWYPYGPSPEFPLVGQGGRNAMAGPVYYFDDYPDSPRKLPRYYDSKLFTYDWIRGFVMAVTLGADGEYVSMERFMPGTTFSNPIDMVVGPHDGALYLLEYGKTWNAQNLDARLVRIDYVPGNRAPVAHLNADPVAGATPLEVHFDASTSTDHDGDGLSFVWDFGDGRAATGASPVHRYEAAGLYTAVLTVTDPAGLSSQDQANIVVGNAPPEVTFTVDGNESFYFSGRPLSYRVAVVDAEDGSLGAGTIAPSRVAIAFDYLPQGFDLAGLSAGHEALAEASAVLVGKRLMEGSDCTACHHTDNRSAGPSLHEIALRYQNDGATAERNLASKIINGGVGNWGEQPMPAHPQHTEAEAFQMVKYIRSFAAEAEASEPPSGVFEPREHEERPGGTYVLSARYTDEGARGMGPLTAQALVVLHPPRIEAEGTSIWEEARTPAPSDDVAPLGDASASLVPALPNARWQTVPLDLTGIPSLALHLGIIPGQTQAGTVEVRALGATETVLAMHTLSSDQVERVTLDFPFATVLQGKYRLVLVFTGADETTPVAYIDALTFHAGEAMP